VILADMSAYLINHLRIPNGVPSSAGLEYLERVEATFVPYGGRWLALDTQVEVLEGAWPGSVVLMEFPDLDAARKWYFSPEYREARRSRGRRLLESGSPNGGGPADAPGQRDDEQRRDDRNARDEDVGPCGDVIVHDGRLRRRDWRATATVRGRRWHGRC
jgi:uncharacterized protein (DUF1330 family)